MVMRLLYRICLTLFSLASFPAFSQLESSYPSQAVSYKVLQDDPAELNNLWLHVQPLTVDVMQMNAVVGSGLEARYLPITKLELQGGIRGNFINSFDFQRNSALQGAAITTQESKREEGKMVITNSFSRFYNVEIGGFYHIMDDLKEGSSKVILSDQALPDKISFPDVIDVNAKTRQVLGARLGFSSMGSAVSIKNALKDQNVTLKGDKGTLISKAGTSSSTGFKTEYNSNSLYSTFQSTGFYIGAGFQRIKNLSIKTDKQGIVSNNSILTVYADLMINPWTNLASIQAQQVMGTRKENFDLSPISLNKVGGRAGFEIRYNQASFVSVGAEIGYRPAIQGQGFYGLFKLSIPTFSFGMGQRKVANNIGKNQSLSK